MSCIIFDTSAIIELEKGNREVAAKIKELKEMHPSPPKISFMTYFEFIYGLRNKAIKNKDKSIAFLELFETIQTTKKTADCLALLKEKYEMSLTDLFIASQVMEEGGILVTKDRDFEKIIEIEKVMI